MVVKRRLQIEYIDPRRLSPAEYNPRVMSEKEMAKLRRSLAKFGFVDPVIVRREGLEIIGGHQRVRAALEQGIREVPVVLLNISAAEAKTLNVALNRIQGDWDLGKLGAILEELRDLPDVDETLTGFDQRDLQDLLGDLEARRPAWEEEPEEIEIPDPARVWVSGARDTAIVQVSGHRRSSGSELVYGDPRLGELPDP